MTSSDAPSPPGGPLREDRPDGPLQPSDGEHGSRPEPDDEESAGPEGAVPPVQREPRQPEAEALAQEENAGTSLDQPST